MIGRRLGSVCQWVLAAGDAAAFLLFAGLGRDQHGESGGASAVVITAAPFLVAWFAVTPRFAVFQAGWRHGGWRSLQRLGLAWLAAWPVALLLRRVVQQRGIPFSFDLVALVANAVFLLTWRGAYLLWAGRRAGERGRT